MGTQNPRHAARLKRKKRIRKKIAGTPERPRMSVFRSAKHIYVQVIDDTSGHTLVAASTQESAVKDNADFANKVDRATFVGKLVAERALSQGIRKVVFDRNGFLYHGRIRGLSQGAREAGLEF